MQLVITEKPSVARAYAAVIGADEEKDGYLEGDKYIVSWCLGHLFELTKPINYSETYKKWDTSYLPIVPEPFKYDLKEDVAEQYDILKSLMEDPRVETIVCATDAGREGELIFRHVYNESGCSKPVKRLWLSSMEDTAVKEAFENLKDGSEYDDLYMAALGREQADWLVGINGTRLFTCQYGNDNLLKVGRVQSPTLAMIVKRQLEIENFIPEPYFDIKLTSEGGICAVSEKFASEQEAKNAIEEREDKPAVVTSVVSEEKEIKAPQLYDLTSLQRDANKVFSYTAKETLAFLQLLYEKKLTTYPRTDAKFLTDDMEDTAKEVLNSIIGTVPFLPGVIAGYTPDYGCILNSKKVTDHHAIIPTVEIKKADLKSLDEGELNILYLISLRLVCATAPKHQYKSTKIVIDVSGLEFKQSGKTVTDNGWKDFDDAFRAFVKADKKKEGGSEADEAMIPDIKEQNQINVYELEIESKKTKPPKAYTDESLLSAMEKAGVEDMDDDVERKGLGTSATRADVIEKLVTDKYVVREKKKLIATENGINLISILPEKVKSAKLTAEWENKLSRIAKGEEKLSEFMQEIVGLVKEIVEENREIDESKKNLFKSPHEPIGKCPHCGSDVVKGKYGVYCKDKCGMKFTYALGKELSEEQISNLINNKEILLKELVSQKKDGKKYSAYIACKGAKPYSYEKDGEVKEGFSYDLAIRFPKKRSKG